MVVNSFDSVSTFCEAGYAKYACHHVLTLNVVCACVCACVNNLPHAEACPMPVLQFHPQFCYSSFQLQSKFVPPHPQSAIKQE